MEVLLIFAASLPFHSRESGNLPVFLTVLECDAERQLECREIPAFAGMEIILILPSALFSIPAPYNATIKKNILRRILR